MQLPQQLSTKSNIISGSTYIFVGGKDGPGGAEHGVHGRSTGGEHLNEVPNAERRQRLLDPVVVLAKVDLPVDGIDDEQQQHGGEQLVEGGADALLVGLLVEVWSAEGGPAQGLAEKVEEREGDEAAAHLTGDADEHLGVVALAEGPHADGDGGVDVLSAADVVSGDDADGVRQPRDVLAVGADPLAGGEGEGHHEEGADELVAPEGGVLAADDEAGRDRQDEARRDVRGHRVDGRGEEGEGHGALASGIG